MSSTEKKLRQGSCVPFCKSLDNDYIENHMLNNYFSLAGNKATPANGFAFKNEKVAKRTKSVKSDGVVSTFNLQNQPTTIVPRRYVEQYPLDESNRLNTVHCSTAGSSVGTVNNHSMTVGIRSPLQVQVPLFKTAVYKGNGPKAIDNESNLRAVHTKSFKSCDTIMNRDFNRYERDLPFNPQDTKHIVPEDTETLPARGGVIAREFNVFCYEGFSKKDIPPKKLGTF